MQVPMFHHPRPVPPAHHRRMNATFAKMNQALDRALNGDPDAAMRLVAQVREALLTPVRMTEQERREEIRYLREVEAYNAAVARHRQAVQAVKQARINQAEVAKVRAGACKRCTMTHAGGPDAC
ncbi:hypothetical protein [Micromonospora sp. WMMC273]|uniref:hypothetical protein n=1 Tax=Micromonospora sp. WMMC273 TaxID=3015157 RepID=UPI0022B5EF07|nr:hypothetical protein [Micromonospora sp. WMMC273]MCZ7478857.1 hypothetical protein [Micromonospora sp. WMMC273]